MFALSNRNHWHRLKQILETALEEASPQRRTEQLRKACGADAALLQEAETLLNQDTTSLEHFAEIAASCLRGHDCDREGERLGAYTILREIGRGGMGAVYLGQRADGQFEKQVAIKILKRGTDTEEVLRRFRSERQILANLEHPNITRLLDAGVTKDNLPYVILEFVEGKPIVAFAEQERCSLRQRLELFLKVCSAVMTAHKQGVIHRDIKPSNILVKSDGEPKLLDFGIAKMVAGEAEDVTLAAEQRLTPKYAAPEQRTGQPSTIATDVYSLGVLLSELLHGTPDGAEAIADAAIRNCLKEVVRHATQTQPEKRYASAGVLADSIRQCLSDSPGSSLSPWRGRPRHFAMTAALIGLVLVSGALIWEKRRAVRNTPAISGLSATPSPASKKIESIAILPFQPIGSENNNELLGLGMADAVIGQVSKIRQISVLPTSAVLKYKGHAGDALAAARELKADAVLTGTIQRSGDRVRINVQLISAREGRTLWTEKFDETFTDVFGIEDSISSEISKALALGLSREEQKEITKHYTSNAEAYNAYLIGLYFYNQRSKEGLQKAIDYFKDAIAKDPAYALAYALLADCYNLQAYYMFAPSADAMGKCKEAAERALSLDSTVPEAHVVMASVQLEEKNARGAMQSLRRALELNSNLPIAQQRYAWALCGAGRLAEAVPHMKRAQELDPLSATNNSALGVMLLFARDFPGALRYCSRAAEIDPHSATVQGNLAEAYCANQMFDQAIQCQRKVAELAPEQRGNALAEIARVLYLANRRPEADAMMPDILQLAAEGKVDAYNLAVAYAASGRLDDSFEWFEKALAAGKVPSNALRYAPELDSLRADPRFRQSLVKNGWSLLLAPK